MYCTECGIELPDNAQFCPECGTESFREAPGQKSSKQPEKTTEQQAQKKPEIDDIPAEKGRIDSRKPPKVSFLTLFFAILALVFILVLLNPWHADQERPEDFQGTQNNSQRIVIP